MDRLSILIFLIAPSVIVAPSVAWAFQTDDAAKRNSLRSTARAVAWLNDGRLVIGDSRGNLYLDEDGKATGPQARGLGDIQRMAVSRNNEIATVALDGSAWIVEAENGWLVRALEGSASEPINELAFTPEGLVVGLGASSTRYVWDASGKSEMRAQLCGDDVRALIALSADGDYSIARTPGGRLALWDAASGELIKTYENSKVPADALAISNNRKYIAVADARAAANILLWNMGDGTFVRALNAPGTRKVALRFTDDDYYLVAVDDAGAIRTFRPDTGEQVYESSMDAKDATSLSLWGGGLRVALVDARGAARVGNFGPSEIMLTSYVAEAVNVLDKGEKYVTVPVFFGTNRADRRGVSLWTEFRGFFTTTVGMSCTAAALALVLLAGIVKGAALARGVFLAALPIIAVVALIDAYDRTREQQSKPQGTFTAECGVLTLGRCRVTIPRSHSIGQLESPPAFWVFRVDADPNSHIVLQDIARFDSRESFRQAVHDTYDKLDEGYEALVFIHGYNVSFDDAARRTAQLAYDLEFQGAPFFFSWPSHAEATLYSRDLRNAEASVPELREFLAAVAQDTGARQIHLIAHSMGSLVLGRALQRQILPGDAPDPFHRIVLAAPDIDQAIFLEQIAPAMLENQRKVTLYVSSNDVALAMARTVYGEPRAGDTQPEILLLEGLDTIDASLVDTSFVGHSYFASARPLLTDIGYFLFYSKPASARFGLTRAATPRGSYWTIKQ